MTLISLIPLARRTLISFARGRVVVLGAALLGGCGRIGYDLTGSGSNGDDPSGSGGSGSTGGAGGDASSSGGTSTAGTGGSAVAGSGGANTSTGGATGSGGSGASGGNAASTGGTTNADGGGIIAAGTTGFDSGASSGGAPASDGGGPCIPAAYGGHDYAFCATPLDSAGAAADCQAQAMRLVRVDDDAENQFVAGIAFAAYTAGANAVAIWPWLGASDRANPVEWFWTDGAVFWSGRSNGTPVGGLYSNWASANPGDTTGTACVTLNHTSTLAWVDRNCTELHPYVCEAYDAG